MKRIAILAAAGAPATVAVVLVGSALAASPSPRVSVRVEGVSRTLLAATRVTTPAHGSITRGGAPSGSCPAASAAGALNVATKGRWSGSYSNGIGIFVTRVLGETNLFAKGHWWQLFINDRPASVGICDLKPRPGEQILLAAVASKGPAEHPIVLSAPAKATPGKPFQVHAFYFAGQSNRPTPLAGVRFRGRSAQTNASGVATLTDRHAGRLSLVGSKSGEIRSAAVTVTLAK